MQALQVRPVRSRRERRQFLNLPWQIYLGDNLWVPPLAADEEALLGFRSHPFYERNESQAFLATRGGEPVGRILAIHNRRYIEATGDARAFFGFFECRDDGEAARGLIDAAAAWLGERGLHRLRGPMNPSIHYQAGLLIDPFDQPPTFMMPYNPPYYGALLEQCGFVKAHDLYAYRATTDQLPGVAHRFDRLIEEIKRRLHVRMRSLDTRNFRQDLAEFLKIVNRSLVGHWSHYDLPSEELDHLVKSLSWVLVPELAVGAEVDGRLAGVAFAIPDYAPRMRKIGGRLFPFGFIRLLANKRAIKKLRVVAANVVPEYHLQGLGLLLMAEFVPFGLAWGATEVEFSWVAESNRASRGSLEKGGAKRVKTYRVYDRDG